MASNLVQSTSVDDKPKHIVPAAGDAASIDEKGENVPYSAIRSIDPVAERRIV